MCVQPKDKIKTKTNCEHVLRTLGEGGGRKGGTIKPGAPVWPLSQRMCGPETGESVWDAQIFLPFPRNCISLLTAPTNSGKSTYIKGILENAHLFFSQPFDRVVVINCHSLVSAYELEQLPDCPWPIATVEHYLLSEFHTEVLQPNDLLIIEDLQELTANLKLLVTAITHHCDLAACFIVTHSLLGSRQFELLSYTHKVILFLKSAAVARLALYIIRHFFVDPELKNYLKGILGVAEGQQAVIHIEINPIAGASTAHHIALSHLLQLTVPKGYCLLYPHPNHASVYRKMERDFLHSDIESLDAHVVDSLPEQLHPDSFVLLNAKAVKEWKRVNGETAAAKNDGCAEEAGEREWTEACNTLEDMIHDTVPAAKLFKAKSLCKELLKNPQFCLDTGGRMMHLVDKPKVKFSVLDYILVAIRQAGPSEMNKVNEANYRLYRLVTKLLLNRNTPTQLIKNKVLLAKVAHGTTVSYPLRPPPRPPKKRLAAAAAAAAYSPFEDEEM